MPEPYNGRIRIGIIPAATSVKIGATRRRTTCGRRAPTPTSSPESANEQVTVTWSSGVAVAINNRRLQVVCTASSTDRDQRVAAGIAAGFPSAWEHVPASGCWRVYIGERPLPIDATAEATYKQDVINAGLATTAGALEDGERDHQRAALRHHHDDRDIRQLAQPAARHRGVHGAPRRACSSAAPRSTGGSRR